MKNVFQKLLLPTRKNLLLKKKDEVLILSTARPSILKIFLWFLFEKKDSLLTFDFDFKVNQIRLWNMKKKISLLVSFWRNRSKNQI
jgi:hypothetical protein